MAHRISRPTIAEVPLGPLTRWLSPTALLLIVACGGGDGGTGPGGEDPPATGFGAALNITNNASTSMAPNVAMSGTGATALVVAVWRDDVGGNAQVYAARSTDGGATFGAPMNLSNGTTGTILPSVRPAVAIAGEGATAIVMVVWHGQTTNTEIFTARSTNGGAAFGAAVNLTNNTGSSAWPVISAAGTGATATFLIAWDGQPTTGAGAELNDILLRRSTNGGAVFGAQVNLSNQAVAAGGPRNPAIALSAAGDKALVAWEDNSGGDYEIIRRVSSDGGAVWAAETQATTDSDYSGRPAVAASGTGATATLVLTWNNTVVGDDRVFVTHSTNGGTAWSAAQNLSTCDCWMAVGISGSGATAEVLIAYEDNADIYLFRSLNGGATYAAKARLTNNSGFTGFASVAMTGVAATRTAVIVWDDDRPTGKDIFRVRSQ